MPGKFHGQKSLVGYSPWGHKELDTTKQLSLSHTHTHLLRWGDDPGLCGWAHTVTRVLKSERERDREVREEDGAMEAEVRAIE